MTLRYESYTIGRKEPEGAANIELSGKVNMDKIIDRFRKIAFKIVNKESALGRVADKLLTREVVMYLIFGVLTTAVNLLAFWAFNRLFAAIGWQGVLNKVFTSRGWDKAAALFSAKGAQYLDSNLLAWVIGVLFAFITNKLFVFESKSFAPTVAVKELAGFVGARVFSFFVETFGLFLMVTVLAWNDYLAKIIVGVIVVIINYVFSKLLIFRKNQKEPPTASI